MKGDAKLIEMLNSLLADELTAINQYMVHAEMAENWGYGKLKELVRKRAIMEMRHAEKLIERVLFLEGRPVVNNLREIRIGADVAQQFASDLNLEMGAVKKYNEGIKLADSVSDHATRTILEAILRDEDSHVDEIESRQDQIAQMGIQQYLAEQA
ncbi:MAG: bacterioferritin [Elusimicrobia bacterium]|nr:bacterioferritin [Elusimicrobiota bacterium]